MTMLQERFASSLDRRASRRRPSRARRAAYTVEFAVCSGLFFFLILSGIEFSRFMFARHTVDQAAYESARIGIIPGRTPDQVRERAQQILGSAGIRAATITITPEIFDRNTATVTVEIRAPFSKSSWLKPLFLASSDLYSSITLDHENQAYLIGDESIDVGDNDDEPIDI
ncbi:MAG: pilus assembly protein [Pirellula sp.]|nr:pilus assembly protein [Pirellula sp.]